MKKITAHQCDFCNKITKTRSGMSKHEGKCFKNPASKSCITCRHLEERSAIAGKLLTRNEHKIREYKVPGTYELITDDESQFTFPSLLPEYEYLHDAEPVNYCLHYQNVMKGLSTTCPGHSVKIESE